MTYEQAEERMYSEGLTYGDAIMLVASYVPDGPSKMGSKHTQTELQKKFLKLLEGMRKRRKTSQFNLMFMNTALGIMILWEFG